MAIDTALRSAAIAAHGETWRLLETKNRTGAEDAAMIAAARFSLENWLRVGTPANEQRGVWLLARVHVDVGDQCAALEYAIGTLALTEGPKRAPRFRPGLRRRDRTARLRAGRQSATRERALSKGSEARTRDKRRGGSENLLRSIPRRTLVRVKPLGLHRSTPVPALPKPTHPRTKVLPAICPAILAFGVPGCCPKPSRSAPACRDRKVSEKSRSRSAGATARLFVHSTP